MNSFELSEGHIYFCINNLIFQSSSLTRPDPEPLAPFGEVHPGHVDAVRHFVLAVAVVAVELAAAVHQLAGLDGVEGPGQHIVNNNNNNVLLMYNR